MTAPSTIPPFAECNVDPDADVVAFVHNLGVPVDVTAYGVDGDTVGYLIATAITDNEVEVVVIPGSARRLTAVPTPPE